MGNTVGIEARDDLDRNPADNGSFTSSSSTSYTVPARKPLMLQRKGSSFLEEPVTRKHTERGEAPITDATLPPRKKNETTTETNASLRFAVSEMQGWRSHMEDMHNLCPSLTTNASFEVNGRDVLIEDKFEDHYLFAVFDGHGGSFTSQFAGENLVRTLTSREEWKSYLNLPKMIISGDGSNSNSSNSRGDVAGLKLLKSALISSFVELDAQLLQAQRHRRLDQLDELEGIMSSLGSVVEQDVFQPGSNDNMMIQNFRKTAPSSLPSNVQLERSGSTGVVVLITPTHIVCANAGDSRALLSRSGMALPLSFDHKPNNDVEIARVEKAGGFVRAGRVDGDLAVSRSFGDFAYKTHCYADASSQRVTVYPDIVVHPRDYGNDEYIVLACDGVWDRMTNRDCASLVRTLIDEGESDPGLICEEVIDHCLELDSRDNMTFALVVLPGGNMSASKPSSKLSDTVGVGVMKRRLERERKWGRNSTPAKRAQVRLDERRKKHKEMLEQHQQSKSTSSCKSVSSKSVSSKSVSSKSVSSQRNNTTTPKRKSMKVGTCDVARQ